jgi:hypothetical protein
VHEGHESDVVVDLPDPHLLSRKHLTESDLARPEADPAAGRDGTGPSCRG